MLRQTPTIHPDCDCPRAVHRHGTRTTYVVHACRCDDCRSASTEGMRKLRRAKLYGRHHLVDAEPVRDHIRKLGAQGIGWKTVARAAGIGASTVYPILYGKHRDQPDHPEHRPPRIQVSRHIADAILAVQLELADGALVDATGTRRRIQALATRGWSLSEVARRLGVSVSNMDAHRDSTAHVTEATRKQVADLYEQLWDVEPPAVDHRQRAAATRARRYAAARGWVPPMAWDDIDDPDETPDVGGGYRGLDTDDILHMASYADHLEDLARLCGVSVGALQSHIQRHGTELPRRILVATRDMASQRISNGHRRAT